MQLSSSESVLWFATIGLDVVLAALIVRLRFLFKFRFFSLFIAISSVRTIFLWLVYYFAGYASSLAAHAFWYSQPLLLISRAAMCVELCRLVLVRSRGLWPIARLVLLVTGGGILVYAVENSTRITFQIPQFVVAAERGLELSISSVLLALLFIASRYGIRIQRTPLLLVTGLCFYSLVQMLNNTLFQPWTSNHLHFYSTLRMIAFQLTQVVWILALFQRDSVTEQKLVQVIPLVYKENSEKVLETLHVLDDELEEISRR